MNVVGQPLDRVDGRLKVTGQARYAAEWQFPDVAYAVLVTGTIAKGRITRLHIGKAEQSPGVIAVLTHENTPKLAYEEPKERAPVDPAAGRKLRPLQNDAIYYNGQPIAIVVAQSFEQATYAASLVQAEYREEKAVTDFATAADRAFPPRETQGSERGARKSTEYHRGQPDDAMETAEVRIDCTYSMPAETHNPMEPHATLARWDNGKLTLYDKTQWVDNVQKEAALAFSIPADLVRVISPFVGGAFGSGLRMWSHTVLAAQAARQVDRPVKLVLPRSQMFTIPGYRPHTVQRLEIGATRQGELVAIRHEAIGQTSTYEEYTETVVDPTRLLYECPNVLTRYRLAAMNVNTPTPMRGPGEATGMFALETAMDELAVALNMDPVALRLANGDDAIDQEHERPWSSKSLGESYRVGAERFGWRERNPQPRSMRAGHLLVGYGMASSTWPADRAPATVFVRVEVEGHAIVRTASSDIGPGTYTVMTQIAADALGLPPDQVRFELGDTDMPQAPVQGGSMTVASVGTAVHEAALLARRRFLELASADNRSPLHLAAWEQIDAADGRLFFKDNPARGETYGDILRRQRWPALEFTHKSKTKNGSDKFSTRAFGAHFIEVRVDPDLGLVRVARVTSVFGAGRIINPKTARSQAIGGIVGGIGMAMLEETVRDERNARVINANLADYHVPVNGDIPDLDVVFLDEHDPHVNPIGAKGIAELCLVGVAAAVGNAVYHATGRRIRDLPITPEKLL
jgi:xanthine dehydrogenase YagR molybdenum-binding subunit